VIRCGTFLTTLAFLASFLLIFLTVAFWNELRKKLSWSKISHLASDMLLHYRAKNECSSVWVQVPSLSGWVKVRHIHLCSVAGCCGRACDPIWQLTLRSSEMGSHEDLYLDLVLLFPLEHWVTSDLHSLRSPATDLASSQLTSIACRLSRSVFCHVFLGLPLLLVPPSGVHCTAALTGLADGRRRTWPTNRLRL